MSNAKPKSTNESTNYDDFLALVTKISPDFVLRNLSCGEVWLTRYADNEQMEGNTVR
jgi:hypothetical protein